MKRPTLLVFASGSKTSGGSGFENLVNASRKGVLQADIVAVISNNQNGGVRERADRLRIPFLHFAGPFTEEGYKKVTKNLECDFVALSGWLKPALGFDPRIIFNIHPGPLPEFGGKGMYGHHVHEAVWKACQAGKLTHSAVTMHFVDGDYDHGPKFFELLVEISKDDSADDIGKKVNAKEIEWQPFITNLVVTGKISWDGKDPKSLILPRGYRHLNT